ncbi:hypothetical protein ARMSODRAFT_704111 [Armillaria solidipes]|uniref:Fungal-type protein kinase domain-containing protein n=1 Tax=Armillaria solidipes TaxID=1076256 RepID=A0A2H3CC51_9AGAR|nr:hypothetical protein ARMSODRAFT_704111 [Armillaria solidipes]
MFGITIANTTTRLWYFSRTVVLMSSPFNFISEHNHFIYYVISMSFGSLQDLGTDTSVVRLATPIDANKKKYRVQYDYLGNTYRTPECLSPLRPSGFVFRATRAREVRKLGDGGEFVLQDVWIPLSAVEIQKRVSHLIERNGSCGKYPITLSEILHSFRRCPYR